MLAALSLLFTQSPSFLDDQVGMQKERGRNNAAPLFGVHRVPSGQQIRKWLGPVAPDYRPFDTWNQLFDFLADGLAPAPPEVKGREAAE
jgi:hypothetical protein